MRLSEFDKKENIDKVVSITGIIASKSKTAAQYGNRYEIELQDKSVREKFSAFSPNGYDEVENGDLVEMSVTSKPPKNGTGIIYSNILKVKKIEGDSVSYFNQVGIEKYKSALDCFIDSIKSQKIKDLTNALITEDYLVSVGGKTMHHGYKNGLAQHIVSVCSYAMNMVSTYQWSSEYDNKVNMDIIVAGALLHDIGKVYEYTTSEEGVGEYTHEAVIIPHIVNGIRMLEREAYKQGIDFQDEDLKHLVHIIASHHGELAQGSPIAPATLEAKIISEADMLDFKLNNHDINTINLAQGEGASKFVGSSKFGYYRPIDTNSNEVVYEDDSNSFDQHKEQHELQPEPQSEEGHFSSLTPPPEEYFSLLEQQPEDTLNWEEPAELFVTIPNTGDGGTEFNG